MEEKNKGCEFGHKFRQLIQNNLSALRLSHSMIFNLDVREIHQGNQYGSLAMVKLIDAKPEDCCVLVIKTNLDDGVKYSHRYDYG